MKATIFPSLILALSSLVLSVSACHTSSKTLSLSALTKAGSVGPHVILQSQMPVGGIYQVSIPTGMSISEYSSIDSNAALTFVQVSPSSLATYTGSSLCGAAQAAGSTVTVQWTLNGLNYCQMTMDSGSWFSQNSGFAVADNHLQALAINQFALAANQPLAVSPVSTQAVTTAASSFISLDVNFFDAQRPATYGLSHFEKLCKGSITGVSAVYNVPAVASTLPGASAITGTFYSCVNSLIPASASAAASPLVTIGSFFINNPGLGNEQMPDGSCFAIAPGSGDMGPRCAFSNPGLLEINMVSTATYVAPQYFARDASAAAMSAAAVGP